MDKKQLIFELNRLFNKYVNDTALLNAIDTNEVQYQVKGILAELDKCKKKDYDEEDIEIIKNIYFYYC